MEPQQLCKYCNGPISPGNFFCPNCGKELVAKPAGIGKQLGIYALSFFLPPLGLFPAFKYLRQGTPSGKRIGIISILLTVVATVLTLFTFWSVMNIAKGLLMSSGLP